MQFALILLSVLAGAYATCPRDFTGQVMKCLLPMQMAVSGAHDMSQACGPIRQSLGCIDGLQERCQDNPRVGTMIARLELGNMRSLCSSYVADENVDSNCPQGAGPQIQSCLDDITSGSTGAANTHSCRKMTSGLDCLRTLSSQCPYNPILQQIDLDMFQTSLTMTCSDNSAHTCDVAKPEKALRRCSRMMVASRLGKKTKQYRCRKIMGGLQCLRTLLLRCPNEPVFTSDIGSLSVLDQQETAVAKYCA